MWSLWSLFRSRRSADAVVFPSAGRGGGGKEGDGTTDFLVRVVCVLLVVCGCRILQFLLAGLGGEGRRRLDASTPKPARWWCVLLVVWVYYSGIFMDMFCSSSYPVHSTRYKFLV
jgi:hypothetical protein